MPELLTAYHEAGHCVMAMMVGGNVEVASISPDRSDRPLHGIVQVRWDRRPSFESECLVALAGLAAEMVYRQEPFHPGSVAEWSEDWGIAWDLAGLRVSDEEKRVRLLEALTVKIYQLFHRDYVWNAVAALADELLAHETIYEPEIDETVRFWLR